MHHKQVPIQFCCCHNIELNETKALISDVQWWTSYMVSLRSVWWGHGYEVLWYFIYKMEWMYIHDNICWYMAILCMFTANEILMSLIWGITCIIFFLSVDGKPHILGVFVHPRFCAWLNLSLSKNVREGVVNHMRSSSDCSALR